MTDALGVVDDADLRFVGRSAQGDGDHRSLQPVGHFSYTNSSGVYQLTGITDVIGITSQFTYGSGSAITQMTTSYGTTSFTSSQAVELVGNTPYYAVTSVRAIEPDGG